MMAAEMMPTCDCRRNPAHSLERRCYCLPHSPSEMLRSRRNLHPRLGNLRWHRRHDCLAHSDCCTRVYDHGSGHQRKTRSIATGRERHSPVRSYLGLVWHSSVSIFCPARSVSNLYCKIWLTLTLRGAERVLHFGGCQEINSSSLLSRLKATGKKRTSP